MIITLSARKPVSLKPTIRPQEIFKVEEVVVGLKGEKGESAYESYLLTTSDIPPMSKEEWSNLFNQREPTDGSVTVGKLSPSLKSIINQTTNTINWAEAIQFNLTLTTSVTLAFSNLTVGKTISLFISGNYAVTWPSYCIVKGFYNGAKKNLIQMYCASNTAGSEYVAVSIFN